MRSCTWIRRFPSTLSSQCPRSRRHHAVLVRLSMSRRRLSSWWKRQLSCRSSLSSTSLTFFKVSSQNRDLLVLSRRSQTLQFQMSVGTGFFCTFPPSKKSPASAAHPSPRVHASVSLSTPAPQLRLWDWVMVLTDDGPYYWDRRAGETRWKMATCQAGGCGPMAAMSVLWTRRYSRRLATCDVVVGTSL